MTTNFSSWPSFRESEKQAVLDVLDSNKVNYWTGQKGREFEKEFASFSDCQHAIAVANGTVALDLCWQALFRLEEGLKPGDEVIVTSRTFLASVSSIVLAGLVPVFADVELDSQNVSLATIKAVVTDKTRAILCVHLGGWPCDMPEIMEFADQKNLFVVEDCAQAHGAKINGQSVGSFGHMAAWSFCQDKIMTTAGEGGMVTTNNEKLWNFAWSFKDHGKAWDTVYNKPHPPGFRWLHESFGTNWRMTEMQAAVGLEQLKVMSEWTAKRNENAKRILDTASQFDALEVSLPKAGVLHAYYKCYVNVKSEQLAKGWSRDRIIQEIVERGVPCFSGSCSEVYLEKAFDGTDFRPEKPLPNARELGNSSIMFLVHPTLTSAEIDLTVSVLESVMKKAVTNVAIS